MGPPNNRRYRLPFTVEGTPEGSVFLDGDNAAQWASSKLWHPDGTANKNADTEKFIPMRKSPWGFCALSFWLVDPSMSSSIEFLCLVVQREIHPLQWEQAGQERWDEMAFQAIAKNQNIRVPVDKTPIPHIATLQTITSYISSKERLPFKLGVTTQGLTHSGSLAGSTERKFLTGYSPTPQQEQLMGYSAIATAASFLFCATKNIEVTERELRRPYMPSGTERGPSRIVQKTLDISAITKRIGDAARGGTGIQKALHLCRGHFSTYTAENPLFGRHVGTFWIPDHMRGKAEFGRVEKDYRVVAR